MRSPSVVGVRRLVGKREVGASPLAVFGLRSHLSMCAVRFAAGVVADSDESAPNACAFELLYGYLGVDWRRDADEAVGWVTTREAVDGHVEIFGWV